MQPKGKPISSNAFQQIENHWKRFLTIKSHVSSWILKRMHPNNSTLFNDSLRLTEITKKQREKPTSPLFSLSLASSCTALNPRVFLNLKPSSNPKTSERHQTKQTTTHNPQQYPNKRSISLPPQKLQLNVQPRLLECLEPNKLWNRHKSTKQCLH